MSIYTCYQCNYSSIGSSALAGSLTDDTPADVEVVSSLPAFQGCDGEKEGGNGTPVTRGIGAGIAARRRRRVSGGLGLMSAYSSQANEPKFRCARCSYNWSSSMCARWDGNSSVKYIHLLVKRKILNTVCLPSIM